MSNVEQSYETESGLVDEYIGTIAEAWFQVAGQGVNPEGWNINLKFTEVDVVEGETTSDWDGTFSERYGVGKGWASYDGGKTVEDTGRPDRLKFHENSMYAKLVTWAVENGLRPVLQQRGPSQHADIWLGLKLRMRRIEFEYGGTIGTIKRTFPVEYLGVVQGATPSQSAAPTPAPEATAPAPEAQTAPAASDNGVADVDAATLQGLRDAKAASGTHGEFVDKAMELTGVTENVNLVMAIADPEKLWKEL